MGISFASSTEGESGHELVHRLTDESHGETSKKEKAIKSGHFSVQKVWVDTVWRVTNKVRHLEKGNGRGGHKVLILTIAVSQNVDGVGRSC